MKTTISQNLIFRSFSRLQRSCCSAVFLLLFLLSASSSWGQTTGDFISKADGNWNDHTKWQRYNGSSYQDATSGQLPTSTSNVIIRDGDQITLNVNTTIKSLTIQTGGNSSDLNFSDGVILTVNGNVVVNKGSNSGDNKKINVGSGTLHCESITVEAPGNSNRVSEIRLSSGTINVTGNITLGSTDADFIFTNAGLVNVSGNMSGGTFVASSGTVNYNNSGGQTVGTYTYNNLTLSGSGAKTVTNATINGILSIQGTATASGTSPTYGTSAILEYKGSAAQTTTNVEFPATLAADLIINNSAGVTLNAAKTVTGYITITDGALNSNNFNLSLTGNWTNNSSFNAGTGTVLFTTTGTSNIAGSSVTTFNNLTKNATGTVTNTVNGTTVSGTLSISSGTFIGNKSSTALTLKVNKFSLTGGTFDACNNATITAVATILEISESYTQTTTSTYTTSGTYAISKIIFTGGGNTTYSNAYATAVNNFKWLLMQVSNNTTLTLQTDLMLFGVYDDATDVSLTVDEGSTIIAGTKKISQGAGSQFVTINGKLTTQNTAGLSGSTSTTLVSTYAPTITLGASSTIEYNATAAQTVTSRADYANITFTGNSTKTAAGALSVHKDVTINNTATFAASTFTYNVKGNWINNGTFTANTSTVNFNGTSAISGSATNTFNNISIAASSSLTAPASNMNVQGNWTNNNTFAHNGGTVTFNGTAQSITGATTFYDLALTNSGVKTFSSNVTVSDNLSIASGVSANLGTGGSHTANSLTLNNLGTLDGTWGSTTSAATYKNNTYFGATTGIVTVGTNTAATPTVTVTPIGTYTYNGSAQGPNAATNTGTGTTYTYSYVGVSPTVYTASATQPTNAGSYNVTATVAKSTDGFWATASSSATAFSIEKRNLSITASDASKCFGTEFSLGTTAFTSSGLQNGETIAGVTLTSAGAASGAAVNSFSIVPSAATGGTFNAANYTISYTNGTLTVNVLPTTMDLTGSTVCTGTTTTITSSTSQSGVNYQLFNSSNTAVGSPIAGTGSGLTWSGVSAGTGYYVKGTNASTSCVSANSNEVTVTVNVRPNSATGTNGSSTVSSCPPAGGTAVAIIADAGEGNTIKWYDEEGDLLLNSGVRVSTYSPLVLENTIFYAEAVSANGCASESRIEVEAKLFKTSSWLGGNIAKPTDWFTPSNWDCNLIPDASTNVVIPTGKTVSILYAVNQGPANANTVTLQGTANVTVTTDHGITVTDKVDVASGATFTLENGASLVQVNPVIANVGSIKVKKETANLGVNDCVFWSSPVQNITMNTFAPNSSNFYWTFNSAVVNNSNSSSSSYSWVGVAPNATFEAGKGYYIKTPNTQTAGTPWTTEFNGTPNNGNIELVYPVEGDITERYYFVGNPYPSAISIDAFMEANAAYINKTIYLFREPNGSPGTGYSTVNKNPTNQVNFQSNGYGINPSGVIPSGQGFLVRLLPTATTYKVVFNNTMRVTNNHRFFNRSAQNNEDAYNLKLIAANARFSQTKVGYYENALNEEEASFDVRSMDDGAFDLGTLLNQKNFKVQARAAYNAADVIPLRFKTNVAGEHRISLTDTNGVFAADQMVIIKDNLTGVQHNLTANGDYVFTSATGTFTNRFEVIYQQAYYTALQANSCGATIANMNSLVYADLVNGATGYRFKVVNNTTSAVQTIDRPQHWFAFNMLSSYDYNTPYTISVQVQKDGVWTGYYGATCTVNSPNIAATGVMQINPSQCGMTLPTIGTVIATTPVAGATGYKFRITNTTANAMGNNLVQEITRTNHWFTLGMLSRYNYGSSYTVEVAVKTTGAFTPYGNACTVYSPSAPTLASCGQTVATATTLVRTTAMTLATQYRFQVTRMSTQETITFDTANYWFSFRVNVPGYAAGEQYGVRVAVMTAGAWSPYGDACDITAPIASARTIEEAAPSEANLFKPVAYPNPFASTFGISLATPSADVVHVMVYDLQGRLIEKQNVFVSQLDSLQIGTNYPSGDYLLVVAQGANIKSSHIHKE